jgi:hypothetical protein
VLAPSELLLVEAGGGRLRPLSAESAFGSGGRALVLAPLHLPHRAVFVAAWGRPWLDAAGLAAALGGLAERRACLRPVRVLASIAFALLFVVGPAATLTLGPDAAVLGVAALLYPTALAALVTLWRRRQRLGLGRARALWLGVEMVVCPAFLPNLVHRLSGAQPLEADGAQLLVATADAGVRDEFLERLRARAEDLLDGAADPAAEARLRAYLAGLRSAR